MNPVLEVNTGYSYTGNVSWSDGNLTVLARRERPQILFDDPYRLTLTLNLNLRLHGCCFVIDVPHTYQERID